MPAKLPNGASMIGEWVVVMTNDPTGSGLRLGIARPVGRFVERVAANGGRATRDSAWPSSAVHHIDRAAVGAVDAEPLAVDRRRARASRTANTGRACR